MSNLSDRGTLRGSLGRVTDDYNNLINKPSINGHELVGDQGGHALGLANLSDVTEVEANPDGAATDDLEKLRVNSTIYQIPDVLVYGEASGAIASFPDGADNRPLQSLKVAITPQQAQGTPTPSDPLPISGWTGAEISVFGKNLFDFNKTLYDGFINASGQVDTNQPNYKHTDYISVRPNTTYTTSGNVTSYVYSRNTIALYDINKNFINRIVPGTSGGHTFTTPSNAYFIIMMLYSSNTEDFYNVQLELGAQATSFEAYNSNSHTYPITWSDAGAVYGGELDVTDGVIHPCKYYASYNGETLVGEWQSSMDEYAEGTTPTIGAQVVDFGAYDTDISIQTPTITSILGNNNIWSDTGDIEECVYQRDLNICINLIIQSL